MNDLQIFKNEEFGQVRALEINGEPYFVGKDVAKVLGYSDTSDAIKKHVDEEDKMGGQITDSLGRLQNTKIINESGLYSLILSSKLPTAKKFKHWVTSEVLPQIRKTGSYAIEKRSYRERVIKIIEELPNDSYKNLAVSRLVGAYIPQQDSSRHKVEMSEEEFRSKVVEFINENDVVLKSHPRGLVIDKVALYKYMAEYGWTQHDVLEALDKYNMIYHSTSDKTQLVRINGKIHRELIII